MIANTKLLEFKLLAGQSRGRGSGGVEPGFGGFSVLGTGV